MAAFLYLVLGLSIVGLFIGMRLTWCPEDGSECQFTPSRTATVVMMAQCCFLTLTVIVLALLLAGANARLFKLRVSRQMSKFKQGFQGKLKSTSRSKIAPVLY